MELDWILMGAKTVELPVDLFARGATIMVPTATAEVLNYFAANPGEHHMAPGIAGAAGMEAVTVQRSTFVPHWLAPYFLEGRRTARDFLQLLVPVIEAQGHSANCKPLLDWLKVASCRGVHAGATPGANHPSGG